MKIQDGKSLLDFFSQARSAVDLKRSITSFSSCATLSSGVQSQGKGKTGDRQEGDRSKN